MSLEPRRHRALSLGALVRRRGLVLSHVEIFGERLLDRISGHDTNAMARCSYSNRWRRRWRRAQSTSRTTRGPTRIVLSATVGAPARRTEGGSGHFVGKTSTTAKSNEKRPARRPPRY